MRIDGRVPPISESGFRRKYLIIWAIAGASCLAVGLAIGPRLNHSHNPWISVVVAFALYLLSMLLAPITLMYVWKQPNVTPAVLAFSIPVGATGIAALFLMKRFAATLLFPERDLSGFALSIGLFYAAALIWGMAVGIRRKQMGDLAVRRRR
jgi:hypothetical protein